MINDDVFSTVIVTFLAAFAAFVAIPIVIILAVHIYEKTKKKILLPIAAVIIGFLVFVCSLITPWIFANLANNQGSVKYFNLAIEAAVLPSVKGEIYHELASFYMYNKHNGALALENFEKAYKYHKTALVTKSLGVLYTIKGDLNKAVEFNSQNKNFVLLSDDYILQKDYKNALKYINIAIKENPSHSWNYIVRAVIYRNLRKDRLAKADYNKALKLCKGCKAEADCMFKNYKTTFPDRNQKKRQLYGFN